MNESIDVIRNSASDPLRVWLEPWVEEILIPPGAEFRFVGEQPGQLLVEESDGRRIVYSWPTSRLTVYHGEEIVWRDFGIAVPPIPDGMAMSEFSDLMSRSREALNESKSGPWWKFWRSRKPS